MATFELGQVVTWTLRTFSNPGQPEDLPETPTATVTLPDGETAAATVARVSRGVYRATLTSTLAGRHVVRWVSATANDDTPRSDIADVWPADPRLVISLEEARAALNSGATVTDDSELRLYIAAATEVIESKIGAVLAETRVETRSGSGVQCIPLHEYPSAITSVVENGTTLAETEYALDENGLLWRGQSAGAGRWSSSGMRNVVITYTVGTGTVPPGVVKAARELVKHQFSVSQYAARPSFDDGSGDPPYAPQSSWFAVIDALEPHSAGKVPGLA